MYVADTTVQLLAVRNWRGIATGDVVLCILGLQDDLTLSDKELMEQYRHSEDCPQAEWVGHMRLFLNTALTDALRELRRRRSAAVNGTPDREIIQVIKARLPVADVIEWYTQVFYANRDTWRFRCTLHGDGHDKDPSGVIYNKEQRWWCFVCNGGGDVFDAVQKFEQVKLPEAIKKLATHLGIEIKPLVEKKVIRDIALD